MEIPVANANSVDPDQTLQLLILVRTVCQLPSRLNYFLKVSNTKDATACLLKIDHNLFIT